MKKILFIINTVILSLFCLCGCSSTSNTNTGEQVVVKKTYNDELYRYDLTPVYLKVDNEYVYIKAWYQNNELVQQLSRTTSRSQARTTCSELIQYDNYFEITLAVNIYAPNSNTSLPVPIYVHKKLSISNSIGAYEIEKYK